MGQELRDPGNAAEIAALQDAAMGAEHERRRPGYAEMTSAEPSQQPGADQPRQGGLPRDPANQAATPDWPAQFRKMIDEGHGRA